MIVNVYLEFYPGIFQEIMDLLIPLNLKCLILVPGLGNTRISRVSLSRIRFCLFICAAEVRSA